MKEKFKSYFTDSLIKNLAVMIFSLGLLQVLLIIFSLPRLPPEVPLFYSLHWGATQLAQSSFLFLIPLSSFFFLFINCTLSVIFFETDLFIKRMLLTFSLLLFLLSSFGLVKIVFLFL